MRVATLKWLEPAARAGDKQANQMLVMLKSGLSKKTQM